LKNRSLLKIQGSKFKLLTSIKEQIKGKYNKTSTWVEPFMGSGVVGINMAGDKAIFSDTNPYIVALYNNIKSGKLTIGKLESELIKHQKLFERHGIAHYLQLRKDFNNYKTPLRFFILNRTSFNGLIRFNLSGEFNSPYCKNDLKISDTLIFRLLADFEDIADKIRHRNWHFEHQSFEKTILDTSSNPEVFTFMDPPYLGRNSTYYKEWKEEQELNLSCICSELKSNFLLTTWYNDKSRVNPYIEKHWKNFNIAKVSHKYIIAGTDKSVPVFEAFISNR
jgi:DNA adenine methylase